MLYMAHGQISTNELTVRSVTGEWVQSREQGTAWNIQVCLQTGDISSCNVCWRATALKT